MASYRFCRCPPQVSISVRHFKTNPIQLFRCGKPTIDLFTNSLASSFSVPVHMYLINAWRTGIIISYLNIRICWIVWYPDLSSCGSKFYWAFQCSSSMIASESLFQVSSLSTCSHFIFEHVLQHSVCGSYFAVTFSNNRLCAKATSYPHWPLWLPPYTQLRRNRRA